MRFDLQHIQNNYTTNYAISDILNTQTMTSKTGATFDGHIFCKSIIIYEKKDRQSE